MGSPVLSQIPVKHDIQYFIDQTADSSERNFQALKKISPYNCIIHIIERLLQIPLPSLTHDQISLDRIIYHKILGKNIQKTQAMVNLA